MWSLELDRFIESLDPEDDEISDSAKESSDYQLVRDRESRVKKPTQMFGFVDLIVYMHCQ